jgi:hypothetical protein
MRGFNLIGQTFGQLTVESRAGRGNRTVLWLCRCSCGNTTEVTTGNLRGGRTSSCGCTRRAKLAGAATTHGMSGSPTVSSWREMHRRCYDSGRSDFEHYGGRGIRVCKRWHQFEPFLADMGERPEGTTLDRIDPFGNYEPGNCRWATPTEQNRNTRANRMLTHAGRTLCLAEWAEETGIKPTTISMRLARGWPVARALTEPTNRPPGAPPQ